MKKALLLLSALLLASCDKPVQTIELMCDGMTAREWLVYATIYADRANLHIVRIDAPDAETQDPSDSDAALINTSYLYSAMPQIDDEMDIVLPRVKPAINGNDKYEKYGDNISMTFEGTHIYLNSKIQESENGDFNGEYISIDCRLNIPPRAK